MPVPQAGTAPGRPSSRRIEVEARAWLALLPPGSYFYPSLPYVPTCSYCLVEAPADPAHPHAHLYSSGRLAPSPSQRSSVSAVPAFCGRSPAASPGAARPTPVLVASARNDQPRASPATGLVATRGSRSLDRPRRSAGRRTARFLAGRPAWGRQAMRRCACP